MAFLVPDIVKYPHRIPLLHEIASEKANGECRFSLLLWRIGEQANENTHSPVRHSLIRHRRTLSSASFSVLALAVRWA